MKAKLSILALALIALIVVIAGCCYPGQREVEIRLAPIHEVRVNIAESFPEQVFVYIKGGLVDSCTTFHDLIVERVGSRIKITLTTQRPRGVACALVYGFFEKNVALGSDFVRGRSYIVDVNGVTTTFKYPG